jgi:hypothetical protein
LLAEGGYDTHASNERAALKELLSKLHLHGQLIQPNILNTTQDFIAGASWRAAVALIVKSNQPTLYRQIGREFEGRRRIPSGSTDQEQGHGRDIRWEIRAKEASDHIKEAWPDSAWIVELTTTKQGRLKVRQKAAGAAMLVPVLSGLLSSVGRPRCHC